VLTGLTLAPDGSLYGATWQGGDMGFEYRLPIISNTVCQDINYRSKNRQPGSCIVWRQRRFRIRPQFTEGLFSKVVSSRGGPISNRRSQ
jgi:hypothetical protein